MRTLSWSTIINLRVGVFILALATMGITSQLLSAPANAYSADAFVMEIDTTKVSPANTIFVVPTDDGGGYDYTVDCDDSGPMAPVSGQTGNYICQYALPGTYSVVITGEFPEISFVDFFETPIHRVQNAKQLIGIKQWGSQQWRSMSASFRYTENLTINASDTPDLSKVTSTSCMFCEASGFTGDLSGWDVSNVTNMANMFNGAYNFNSDLSKWDVSNVTNMSGMFYMQYSHIYGSKFNSDLSSWDVSSVQRMDHLLYGAQVFTSNLSDWDVSNVTTMERIFASAYVFTSDLSGWDVSNVTNMKGAFASAYNFNSDLSDWDVSNVRTMEYMFLSAYDFNSDISRWDVSRVTNMSRMFDGARNFDSDLSDWDVSSVNNMYGAFWGATRFNQDISSWDLSSATNLSSMFYNAQSFNQDISGWNVGDVTDMSGMFSGAQSFNQSLGNWNISNVTTMWSMLDSSGLSQANYEATLNAWATQSVQPNVTLGADGMHYCDNTGHDILTSAPNNWIIQGDYWCDASPIIESVSPAEVTTTNKPLELTIEGSGFLPGSVVSIDGLEVESATFSSYSKNLHVTAIISATTPVGGYDITVTNPGGQEFTLTNGLTVKAPNPEMQEVMTQGPYDNGMLVAVFIQDYVEGSEFWFGDTQVEPVLAQYDDWDDRFVVAFAIPTPEDLTNDLTVDVTMTTPGGQSSTLNDAYTYTPRFDTITNVTFDIEDGKKIMTVHGNNFFKYYLDIYEKEYGITLENTPEEDFMAEFGMLFNYGQTKPVTINGITPGYCTDGLGFTENEAYPFFDGTSTASDNPPCYLMYDLAAQKHAYSNSQFKIWLPNSFDIDKPGTVSILGSKTHTFNADATPPAVTNEQLLAPVNTDTLVAQPLRAATLGVSESGEHQGCANIDTLQTHLLTPDTVTAPVDTTILGGVGFELTCRNPGDSALVSLRLGASYDDTSVLSAYKDLTGDGTLTPVDVTFVNRDGATYVEFPLTDGLTDTPTGLIDEDGEADGRIVDPLYIGVASGTPAPTQPGSTIPGSPGNIPGASPIERALGTNSSSLLAPNSGLQRLEATAKEWLWPIALVAAVVTGSSILLTAVALKRSRRSAYTS